MRDSNTHINKKKNLKKDSAIFDIVEFGSTSRVSVLYNIVHSDYTGYFSLVDNSPVLVKDKARKKYRARKS